MSNYNPDNWVVIKMNGDDPHYRVLAGWSGGYLDGDSWRMNSGIVRVEDAGDRFNFYGSTGSCYSCGKESYCIRMNNAHVWAQLQEQHGDKVEMLDGETDWLAMDWIIELLNTSHNLILKKFANTIQRKMVFLSSMCVRLH